MADYRTWKCFGTYTGASRCSVCPALASCKRETAKLNSMSAANKAATEVPEEVLEKALEQTLSGVRSIGAGRIHGNMPNQAVFHEGRQYDLLDILNGFISGSLTFVRKPNPVVFASKSVFDDDEWNRPVPTTAPQKKLGKTLEEIFAEDEKQKARNVEENKKMMLKSHRQARKPPRAAEPAVQKTDIDICLDDEFVAPSPVQAEAECLDNRGMEEYFDIGITYLVETHVDPQMIWVIDRFGTRQECFRSRFSKVSI